MVSWVTRQSMWFDGCTFRLWKGAKAIYRRTDVLSSSGSFSRCSDPVDALKFKIRFAFRWFIDLIELFGHCVNDEAIHLCQALTFEGSWHVKVKLRLLVPSGYLLHHQNPLLFADVETRIFPGRHCSNCLDRSSILEFRKYDIAKDARRTCAEMGGSLVRDGASARSGVVPRIFWRIKLV